MQLAQTRQIEQFSAVNMALNGSEAEKRGWLKARTAARPPARRRRGPAKPDADPNADAPDGSVHFL